MKSIDIRWLACVSLLFVLPGQAFADASTTQPVFDKPVAMKALEASRGGSDLVRNDMKLIGTTSGNSATNVVTGSNLISSGAFSNMSGLPLVIQNSGANVLIQNAVILNLQMN